jgi:Fic family protein
VLPRHEDVPELVTEACDLVHERWDEAPLFLAAYVLWRICWSHPFDDGNGRTARAASYLVLSVRLGFELPGRLPIPARIKHAPIAYTRALEAADAAWSRGVLDVSGMQELLAFYLEAQLKDERISRPRLGRSVGQENPRTWASRKDESLAPSSTKLRAA